MGRISSDWKVLAHIFGLGWGVFYLLAIFPEYYKQLGGFPPLWLSLSSVVASAISWSYLIGKQDLWGIKGSEGAG